MNNFQDFEYFCNASLIFQSLLFYIAKVKVACGESFILPFFTKLYKTGLQLNQQFLSVDVTRTIQESIACLLLTFIKCQIIFKVFFFFRYIFRFLKFRQYVNNLPQTVLRSTTDFRSSANLNLKNTLVRSFLVIIFNTRASSELCFFFFVKSI